MRHTQYTLTRRDVHRPLWNLDDLRPADQSCGAPSSNAPPEIHVGTFPWGKLAARCQVPIPRDDPDPG
jgi:hypothetical protein